MFKTTINTSCKPIGLLTPNKLLSLLRPEADKLYLDIGCGTGNYTCALCDKGFRFVGVEPSERMLNEAKSRSKQIEWLSGTAEQIPKDDGTFDGIIATLTIHHWADLNKAFIELSRVLLPNGRIVIFTSTPEQMKGYWLNHYFPLMLRASAAQMPSLDAIKSAAREAKLNVSASEKYFVKDDLEDCFLYVGKNNPERYFNAQIRHGISSFSSLSNEDEVQQGLLQLRSDIDRNAFEKIRKQYENDLGDYLFITIEKGNNLKES